MMNNTSTLLIIYEKLLIEPCVFILYVYMFYF